MKKNNIDKTDWDISEVCYDANFARLLSEDKQHLESYKKRVIKEYNETKNVTAFLEGLKIIVMAKLNMPESDKKANRNKTNIYKVLSEDRNPSFNTVKNIAHNLGFDFIIKSA
jgi:DNA-binding phage protein